MKSIHTKKTYTRSNLTSLQELNFEAMATELDQLAKTKLPDGCLDGLLRGHEAEIRQDAVLLSLRWFARNLNQGGWISARSLAYALRYIKMRYARDLSKKLNSLVIVGADPTLLDLIAMESHTERPMSTRSHASAMVLQAIAQAKQSGRISATNADIVLMVLEDGQTVAQVAEKRQLTRGAVYQQINRVRATLPAILDQIEEPGFAT